MEGESNCCICLESLHDPAHTLGVMSCGHPIHEACFRSFEKSRTGRDSTYGRRAVSCPTCNQKKISFIRIYLNIPSAEVEEDDDDDSSVESNADDEEADDNTEEDEENEGNGANFDANNNEASNAIEIADDSEEELPANNSHENEEEEVVDLTAPDEDEEENAKKKKGSNKPRTEGEKKLKRKVKRIKQQLKQCESKYQECNKKRHELVENHRIVKEDLEEMKEEIKEMEKEYSSELLELANLRMETTVLKRQLEEAKRRGDKAEQELKKATNILENQTKRHAKDLELAKHSKSVEVKKILNDYPLVLEKYRKLQEEIKDKEKTWAGYRAKLKEMEPKYRQALQNGVKENGPRNARQIKKDLVMMNTMHNTQQHQHQLNNDIRKKRPQSQITPQCTVRPGATINAPGRKIQIPKHKKAKTAGIDAILSGKNTTKANLLGITTNKSRKTTPQHRQGGFGKKGTLKSIGSGNNDIRLMFGSRK